MNEQQSFFHLSDSDNLKVRDWQKSPDHLACHESYKGAIGGGYYYWWNPTSIGVFYGVTCVVCDEEINLTDYDSL